MLSSRDDRVKKKSKIIYVAKITLFYDKNVNAVHWCIDIAYSDCRFNGLRRNRYTIFGLYQVSILLLYYIRGRRG